MLVAPGPIEGVRILDLTRVLAGPFATQLLADLGAEVWKVERPGEGDETRHIPPQDHGESHYFLSVNRNKKSLAIDLKNPAGRDLVLDLARHTDVVVENFRPGVTGRLGLDYEAVRAVNSEVIYCSISAFGQSGPLSGRSAFDVAMQAMGGGMSVTGEPGGKPMRMGLPMADLGTGLFAVVGVLAAIADRQRTGKGQLVDVAMFDSMIGLLSQFAGRYFMTGEDTEPVGSGHPSIVPYGAYETSDGYIVIANLGEAFWPKIARALGRPELGLDERYRTNAGRLQHRAELEAIVSAAVRQRTTAEWEAVFETDDVPHAPVMKPSQILSHPQTLARGMVTHASHPLLGEIALTGRPIFFPRYQGGQPDPPPLLGQHTDSVLGEVLGLSAERLAALRSEGVIG